MLGGRRCARSGLTVDTGWKEALTAGATIGELCDVLRPEWRTYEAVDLL
jgi:hypothetical protein